MTSDAPTVRVRPLISALNGNDPVEFIHRLIETGYDRFYVKVPRGFRVSLLAADPFPPGYQLWRRPSAEELARSDRNESHIRYLQLDTSQLRELIEHPPIALRQFNGGGLEASLARNGLPSPDFKYRKGMQGVFLPTEAAVADKVPTEFDSSSDAPRVVKTLNRIRSHYSYVLHGISFKDIFIEESALSEIEAKVQVRKVATSACKDLPDDPYGLKESSPLVYEILLKAYQNRGKARSAINTSKLAADFKDENSKYEKNPKPFNNGRNRFAANLANPAYKYSSKPPKLSSPLPAPVVIAPDAFLDQDFINEDLKKLLYAACCWNGSKQPLLQQDPMNLVELLRGLGLRDADENDPVQKMLYFVAGEFVSRKPPDTDYRDARGGNR